MQLDQFKRWHWAVVGLLIGLCFSLWRGWVGTEGALISRSTIDPTEFEQMLAKKSPSGQPLLRDIRYHGREDGIDWVTADRLVRKGKAPESYLPVKVAFERPYPPIDKVVTKPAGTGGVGGGAQLTVVDYLHSVKAKNPEVRFSTRWWDQEPTRSPLFALLGMALMAGACPAVLNFLNGGGGAVAASSGKHGGEYDLSRFGKGKPEPRKGARGGGGGGGDASAASAATATHLRELEAELERKLSGKDEPDGPPAAQAVPATSASPTGSPPPAVRKLDAAPVDATPPATADEKSKAPKRYGGEFYPTETHVKKDDQA